MLDVRSRGVTGTLLGLWEPGDPDEERNMTGLPMTALLDAALDYASRGWPVFPVAPGGKVPLISRSAGGKGLHDATTDADVIRRWWARCPSANIGLPTGIAFDVVDIDGPEGLEALNAHRAERPIAWGPEAVTGGGGWHLYHLPCGAGNRAGVVPHVDYRGRGGYVVAPPSVHKSGRRYEWAAAAGPDEPLEPLPAWLHELVAPARPVASPASVVPITGKLDAYAARALDAELGRVAMANEGTRNDVLNRAAFALGQLVAGGVLSLDLVVARLLDAATRCGLTGPEVEATIASGLRTGARQPRRVRA